MNPFQKYWSYFSRITIEKTSSSYNPQLIVAVQDGKYVLNTQNANYSFGSLHRVFQQIFRKLDLEKQNISTILLLGGGTGSIPYIIYKELRLFPKIDAVEIDKKVVELGNNYFQLNKYPNLSIHIEDATQYVEKTTSQYDLIIIDLFKGINVPEKFYSLLFFSQIKTLLTTNGILIFNFVAYNYETKELVKKIRENLQKVFNKKVETFKLEKINIVFCVRK